MVGLIKKIGLCAGAILLVSVSFASTEIPTAKPAFEPNAEYQLQKLTSNAMVEQALEGFKGGLVDLEDKLKAKKLNVDQITLLLNALQARQNQLLIAQNQRMINQNQKIIQLLTK